MDISRFGNFFAPKIFHLNQKVYTSLWCLIPILSILAHDPDGCTVFECWAKWYSWNILLLCHIHNFEMPCKRLGHSYFILKMSCCTQETCNLCDRSLKSWGHIKFLKTCPYNYPNFNSSIVIKPRSDILCLQNAENRWKQYLIEFQ